MKITDRYTSRTPWAYLITVCATILAVASTLAWFVWLVWANLNNLIVT